MARMRMFIVLAIAVSAGGALAFATYGYLQTAPVQAAASVQTRPVIVAAVDLQVGAALRPDDLRAIEWPSSSVPEGAFGQTSEIVGRGVVVPIARNEPILPVKLASMEAGTGLPPAIPPGMRAMSVRVNEVVGVAGFVLPGTRVDVLVTATPTERRPDTTAKLVLANVPVLTAGTKLEQTGENGKPMPATVVTLLVTPEQAERLTLGANEGKIQLALRNPLDDTAPATPGIKPAVLLGAAQAPRRAPRASTAAAPAAAPAPPALPSVEMIRGDKRAVEVVK